MFSLLNEDNFNVSYHFCSRARKR